MICAVSSTEAAYIQAARNRQGGSMRLREGLRSNRRCDVSVLARIMEDYAFLCIYASRRNALNSAEADAGRSSGYMHDGDTDHLLRCDLRWPP